MKKGNHNNWQAIGANGPCGPKGERGEKGMGINEYLLEQYIQDPSEHQEGCRDTDMHNERQYEKLCALAADFDMLVSEIRKSRLWYKDSSGHSVDESLRFLICVNTGMRNEDIDRLISFLNWLRPGISPADQMRATQNRLY